MVTHLNKSLHAAIHGYIRRYGIAALLELIVTILSSDITNQEDILNHDNLQKYITENYE